MPRPLVLYGLYLGQFIKTHLVYRLNFWIEMGSYVLWILAEIALIYYLFVPVKAIAGWTFEQVLLMYGLAWAAFGAAICIFHSLFFLPGKYILDGELDRLLLRPIDPFGQLIMERPSVEDVITVVSGLAMIGYAFTQLGVPHTVGNWLLVVLVLTSGTMIFGGFMTAAASLSFWAKDRRGFMHPVINAGDQLGRYPLSIFPTVAQKLLTFVLPLGFLAFYPSQFFFENSALIGYAYWTPVVGILTMAFGYGVWRKGLRSYESTGS